MSAQCCCGIHCCIHENLKDFEKNLFAFLERLVGLIFDFRPMSLNQANNHAAQMFQYGEKEIKKTKNTPAQKDADDLERSQECTRRKILRALLQVKAGTRVVLGKARELLRKVPHGQHQEEAPPAGEQGAQAPPQTTSRSGNLSARIVWLTKQTSTSMRHGRPQRYSAYPNLGNQGLHNTMMRVTEQKSGPGNAQAKIHRLRRPMGTVQSFVFHQQFCFFMRKLKNQKQLGGSVR